MRVGSVSPGAGRVSELPTVRSWITPKAREGTGSAIEGRGVQAIAPIRKGEIVAVKGGHITDAATVAGLPEAIRNSGFPLADDHYLAALHPDEHEDVMMLVNHSCAPNVGMGGNILLVAVREIGTGEEVTIDYALFLGDPEFVMDCNCGTEACRGTITGDDWRRPELQVRHRGRFAWWIQRRIDGGTPT